MPGGRPLREGERVPRPGLADALERLAADGPGAVLHRRRRGRGRGVGGGARRHADARGPRRPTRRSRASRSTSPTTAARCSPTRRRAPAARCSPTRSRCSTRASGRRTPAELVDAMERAQDERTPAFLEGLDAPDFLERFMAGRLGSTTHISVLDADGWACSVTCTNGEGSGLVVPGTGMHVNNMMGEQDLSPLGFFTHPPGRRLPSMMAPTVVLARRGARARARLGGVQPDPLGAAAGDRRRDRPRAATPRRRSSAPRLHFEDGIVYAEPGIDTSRLEAAGRTIARVPRAQPVLRRLPGRRARRLDGDALGRRRPAPRRRRRGRLRLLTSLRSQVSGNLQSMCHARDPTTHQPRRARSRTVAALRTATPAAPDRRIDARLDAERERLGRGPADARRAGRLDSEELEERIGRPSRAARAPTWPVLTPDLPEPAGARAGRATARARSAVLPIAVLLVAIWAVTGAGYFWPMWPLMCFASRGSRRLHAASVTPV